MTDLSGMTYNNTEMMIKSVGGKNDRERFTQRMFDSSPSDEHLDRYFRIIEEGIAVNSHEDLLKWLQGEMQHYVSHEIMLAVWFDVGANQLRHDLVSALPGVRTGYLQSEDLLALQRRFYSCWVGLGKAPFRLNLGACSFRADIFAPLCAFGEALHGMRSLLVHGISDVRGGQDCLYVIFSSTDSLDNSTLAAMENLLPYLDTALRRVRPLHRQYDTVPPVVGGLSPRSDNCGLTTREVEVLHWASIGKANADIASILEISVFTVKNHMQNIFKKLNVCNRIQAVAKLGPVPVPVTVNPELSFPTGTSERPLSME